MKVTGETHALIPAAGRGERFSSASFPPVSITSDRREGDLSSSKLFQLLGGRPVLAHTLLAFENCPEISGMVLVGSAEGLTVLRDLAVETGIAKPLIVV